MRHNAALAIAKIAAARGARAVCASTVQALQDRVSAAALGDPYISANNRDALEADAERAGRAKEHWVVVGNSKIALAAARQRTSILNLEPAGGTAKL